ncbi:hypothetical protein MMPV_001828 [Pyropia vietnamensis]
MLASCCGLPSRHRKAATLGGGCRVTPTAEDPSVVTGTGLGGGNAAAGAVDSPSPTGGESAATISTAAAKLRMSPAEETASPTRRGRGGGGGGGGGGVLGGGEGGAPAAAACGMAVEGAVLSDLARGSGMLDARKRDSRRLPRALRRGDSSNRGGTSSLPTPQRTYLNLSDGTAAVSAALAALTPPGYSAAGGGGGDGRGGGGGDRGDDTSPRAAAAAEAAAEAAAYAKISAWAGRASACDTLVRIAPAEPIVNLDEWGGVTRHRRQTLASYGGACHHGSCSSTGE